ncbi:MAG: hydroxymethylbilane synthase [Myxococcota bacterium]
MTTIRLATRGSDLAITQSRGVARRIESELGIDVELVPVKTTGDRIQSQSLAKVGGKGLFVKEIEDALLHGRADLAVHSAKDLPAEAPRDLVFVAWTERADPRDALVARERGATLAQLRSGARVGTGSIRRRAQLLARRPDLEVVAMRGNVPTRLRKLEEEGLDAVVLACAGLDRLGLSERIDERISPDDMLPAVAQGILALEARRGDPLAADLAALGCPRATASAAAERAFLSGLQGDCTTPLAALAEESAAGGLRLRSLLTNADGDRMLRDEREAPTEDAARAGSAAAAAILASGGDVLLASLREEAAP